MNTFDLINCIFIVAIFCISLFTKNCINVVAGYTNLAISFQYVIFLITVKEEMTLPGPIFYSLYKNIILYTASIVEGSLYYLLDTLIKRGDVKAEKVLGKEDSFSNRQTLFKAENGLEICGVHYRKIVKKLSKHTNFIDINRSCKRAKIIDETLFSEVEDLREKRNKIHLAGLTSVDDYYDEVDINNAFETAKKILFHAEKLLEEKDDLEN